MQFKKSFFCLVGAICIVGGIFLLVEDEKASNCKDWKDHKIEFKESDSNQELGGNKNSGDKDVRRIILNAAGFILGIVFGGLLVYYTGLCNLTQKKYSPCGKLDKEDSQQVTHIFKNCNIGSVPGHTSAMHIQPKSLIEAGPPSTSRKDPCGTLTFGKRWFRHRTEPVSIEAGPSGLQEQQHPVKRTECPSGSHNNLERLGNKPEIDGRGNDIFDGSRKVRPDIADGVIP